LREGVWDKQGQGSRGVQHTPDKNDAVCVSASVSSRGVDFGFGEFEFGSVFGGAFHFEHESPRLGGDFDVVAQRVVNFDAAFDFVPVTGALRDHAVGVLGLGFEPLQRDYFRGEWL
jgi:hypothetical protein